MVPIMIKGNDTTRNKVNERYVRKKNSVITPTKIDTKPKISSFFRDI